MSFSLHRASGRLDTSAWARTPARCDREAPCRSCPRSSTDPAGWKEWCFGLVALSHTGRILATNRAVDIILDRRDGLARRRAALRALSPRDDERLQKAIWRVTNAAAGPSCSRETYLRIGRPSGNESYALHLIPVARQAATRSACDEAALLTIADPHAVPIVAPQSLMDLFGYTFAEARLVARLVAGLALPAIASELDICFETARTHLARARAKAGARSQADLVRMVLLALGPRLNLLAEAGPFGGDVAGHALSRGR